MARRKRIQRDWPGVLQALADSGLTVSAFCRQQDIDPSLVYRWRRRLEAAPTAPALEPFVELHPTRASDSGVAVVSEAGWRLELETGFDETTLQRALACVAHQAPCSP